MSGKMATRMSASSAWLRSLAAEATPGPWELAEEAAWQVIAPVGYRVAHCGTFPGTPDPRPRKAESDACLIALAPDLAVLCADAIDALNELLDSDGHRAGRQLRARRQAQDMLARFAALQPDNTKEET